MSKKKAEVSATTFVRSYWDYYLDLEHQFWETRRFVDFSKKNYATFSIEYLKLLQAICSEIDVLSKVFVSYINPSYSGGSIQSWGYHLQQSFKDIQSIAVEFNSEYMIQPWENWYYEEKVKVVEGKPRPSYVLKDKAHTPQWWVAYNKSKHERTSLYNNNNMNYERANLKNVIYALSALFILEVLFSRYISSAEKKDIAMQDSILFQFVVED